MTMKIWILILAGVSAVMVGSFIGQIKLSRELDAKMDYLRAGSSEPPKPVSPMEVRLMEIELETMVEEYRTLLASSRKQWIEHKMTGNETEVPIALRVLEDHVWNLKSSLSDKEKELMALKAKMAPPISK